MASKYLRECPFFKVSSSSFAPFSTNWTNCRIKYGPCQIVFDSAWNFLQSPDVRVEKTRFTSASNAFHRYGKVMGKNGCRPTFSGFFQPSFIHIWCTNALSYVCLAWSAGAKLESWLKPVVNFYRWAQRFWIADFFWLTWVPDFLSLVSISHRVPRGSELRNERENLMVTISFGDLWR